MTNGFDAASGQEVNDGTQFGYILGAELTVPDSLGFLGGSSLYVGYVDGKDAGNFGLFPTGAADADGNPIQAPNVENELLYIGASVNTPIEGVAIGIAYDDRQWGNHFDSDSVALYATYSLSEDASLSVRYDNGTAEFAGAEDSFENLALTLDYSIWENVLTRFEMGWESGVGAVGQQALTGGARPSTSGGGVYDGHGNSSYFALNAFYSF